MGVAEHRPELVPKRDNVKAKYQTRIAWARAIAYIHSATLKVMGSCCHSIQAVSLASPCIS